MYEVRINIADLTAACIALYSVKVLAAGSLYATLECDEVALRRLTKAGIIWTLD
ncbi:hypothetical protein PHIM7_307 [Sinorhizobium phage phiM7]|uniref:Uncharacterized protein n=3 Tax=Emdodecavirus TaxID=1980937 RepID=S5MDH6_9CAUD|nr:hypothetical protein AB690_gp204 [Sinorhizobium phage phiM12]YP_009212551.1 hypothetical protein AVT40_gp222 [Sinorhizobium phage phiN3]YP_009601432.1 hypothetical protein FDH46_gp171 [Sinorhizobium phage phiM7]AKF13212.1 hypothetical protein PHIM19_307 [Sinorhizobium phage phiM19]AGR48029.1 hypothetical protein SmphiM12_397 [Sinorhizobium phage phiM12]AKF12853.1 hypothetical protein PHIM7_307 [Sinorhizobium phage phiM7]AKF13574.1 hypothetical protein PHIN3_311 [Sinorhizobium phage phiN3]